MSDNSATGKLWMWSTVASIALFMLFFIGFAIWTFQGDVELVYDNYYDKDVVYEEQINRIERTAALPVQPEISYDGNTETINIKFPENMDHVPVSGEILVFRPANLNKDRLYPLNLSGDTTQSIDLAGIDKGLWRIKLNWESDQLEYYMEQAFLAN